MQEFCNFFARVRQHLGIAFSLGCVVNNLCMVVKMMLEQSSSDIVLVPLF